MGYALFSSGTVNQFLANLKETAEAYGWVIDYWGTYSGANYRLHLHNTAGAHFDFRYKDANLATVHGCTGYSAGAAPAAQPNASAGVDVYVVQSHLIVVGPSAIFIRHASSSVAASRAWQIGAITEKVGNWSGVGVCISGVMSATLSNYKNTLWGAYTNVGGDITAVSSTGAVSQVLLGNVWTSNAAKVYNTYPEGTIASAAERAILFKQPMAYSGGILPVPLLLYRVTNASPVLLQPIGYAPDVLFANGGDVYREFDTTTINGQRWLWVCQEYNDGSRHPNMLVQIPGLGG